MAAPAFREATTPSMAPWTQDGHRLRRTRARWPWQAAERLGKSQQRNPESITSLVQMTSQAKRADPRAGSLDNAGAVCALGAQFACDSAAEVWALAGSIDAFLASNSAPTVACVLAAGTVGVGRAGRRTRAFIRRRRDDRTPLIDTLNLHLPRDSGTKIRTLLRGVDALLSPDRTGTVGGVASAGAVLNACTRL